MTDLVVSDSVLGAAEGISTIIGENIDRNGNQRWLVATTSIRDVSEYRPLAVRFPGLPYPVCVSSRRVVRRAVLSTRPTRVRVETLGPLGVQALREARRVGAQSTIVYHTDLISYAFHRPVIARLAVAALGGPSSALRRSVVLAVQSLLEELLGLSDEIVVHSKKAERLVRDLGYRGEIRFEEVTASLPHGRHLERSPDLRAIYVGRLAREKNLELLLESFSDALRSDERIKLRLVGPIHGAGISRMIRAKRRELGPALEVIGEVPREEVATHLAASRCLVMPSMTDTLSVVILEAADLGLPMIVVDPEIAQHHRLSGSATCRPEAAALAGQVLRVLTGSRCSE